MSKAVIKKHRPDKCVNLVPGNEKAPFPHCDMRDGREGFCPFSEDLFRQTWCRFYQRPCSTPAPKPKKQDKVIAEAKAGETMDMSDLVALFDSIVELTDYCHRDPARSEYKVLKSFKVVVEK